MTTNNTLYVKGEHIPKIDDDEIYFLNRLTILYGPSGTGKSSLISHIINTLRHVVPVAIVCCPTNQMNGDYTGVFPDSCIHDDLTKDIMERLFDRQNNMIAMYNKVRDIDQIIGLFNKCASESEKDRISNLKEILESGKAAINEKYSSEDAEVNIKELEGTYKRKTIKTLRRCIKKNIKYLSSIQDLTENENVILTHFNINPNLLLIVDDCAASIKSWRDLEETKKLFFQGRHYKVTVLLTMQNESIISPPLRQNAHISIFTTERIVNTYFSKTSSGVSNEDKKRYSNIANVIFNSSDKRGEPNYKKMVYFSPLINTENKLQYMIAKPVKHKFGSAPFWEFCEKTKKNNFNENSHRFNKMFNLSPKPILSST